jgi:hypothetical protein
MSAAEGGHGNERMKLRDPFRKPLDSSGCRIVYNGPRRTIAEATAPCPSPVSVAQSRLPLLPSSPRSLRRPPVGRFRRKRRSPPVPGR